VEHESCPKLKKFVRAQTYISGYYIQTIEKDPPKSKFCTISQTDIGGSIPLSLINAFSKKAPKEWINTFKKGLDKIKNKL
jgi:hypothetical protein